MVEAVQLPFRGKIIYDGIISTLNITIGSGLRSGFEENLRTAKANNGIITSLPWEALAGKQSVDDQETRPTRALRARAANVQEVLKKLVSMTDVFCQTRLKEEYGVLCRKLAAKRPSPLLRGELRTWACGIIGTIGRVNFLDDRSQSPHMKLTLIDQAFDVGHSYNRIGIGDNLCPLSHSGGCILVKSNDERPTSPATIRRRFRSRLH